MSPPGKPQPLTPPRSDRLEHQRLVSSNSASPYQRGLYEHENIPQLPQLPPHSHTTFSSPESHRGHIDPYEQGLYQYPTREEELHQDSIELQRDLGLDVNPVGTSAKFPHLFANASGRISTVHQRIMRLRMVRTIILFSPILLVTTSTSLLAQN